MAKNVEVYHYTKCVTCRQARKFLTEKGAQLTERDFFKDRFTEAELRKVVKGTPVSEAFSWKSPQVKARGLQGKTLTEKQMIALMLEEPRLIRRPIIIIRGKKHFGFRRTELEGAL